MTLAPGDAGPTGAAFADYCRQALADPATPAHELELCRRRYEQLLGAPGLGPSVPGAGAVTEPRDDAERTCVTFGEQFLLDAHQVSDQLAGEVRAHLGEKGFVAFVLGLGLVEQYLRAALVLRAMEE